MYNALSIGDATMLTDEMINQFIAKYDGSVKVVHDKYERYGSGGICRTTIKRKSLKDVLMIIHNKMLYMIDQQDLDEECPDQQQQLVWLFKQMDDLNGDGCDYIISMETNGFVLDIGDVVCDQVDEL